MKNESYSPMGQIASDNLGQHVVSRSTRTAGTWSMLHRLLEADGWQFEIDDGRQYLTGKPSLEQMNVVLLCYETMARYN